MTMTATLEMEPAAVSDTLDTLDTAQNFAVAENIPVGPRPGPVRITRAWMKQNRLPEGLKPFRSVLWEATGKPAGIGRGATFSDWEAVLEWANAYLCWEGSTFAGWSSGNPALPGLPSAQERRAYCLERLERAIAKATTAKGEDE